ncbi:hypothetical protein Vadar_019481 [Vaccinium darrowii]|uniref:Uncharacterized protein n=1 Tax=Vaccinium darrowii TaxID=229202 RepID=A0ACB7Z549_9ERIC|nr:hypothetical protein Vadar_019481 [Vaccinium darrowii]
MSSFPPTDLMQLSLSLSHFLPSLSSPVSPSLSFCRSSSEFRSLESPTGSSFLNPDRGFLCLRFNSVAEANLAISDLNGVVIRDRKILVKMATYCRVKEHGGVRQHNPRSTVMADRVNQVSKVNKSNEVLPNNLGSKSFAEMVMGNARTAPRRISVKATGNEWLTRSVVAKLKSLSAMESIREALHCHGVPQFEVKDFGGLWVVVTFPSSEQMLSVFDGELSWLKNWFAEVKKWNPDLKEARRRNIWISCYGVPLHCWSASTFQKIAQLWGEVLTMDDATIKGLSFACGKIMIATEKWEWINEVIQLEVNGKIYDIRVVEEQVVIHGHCSVCSHNSSESTRVDSTPVEKFGNSTADSIDEANSRRDVEHWEREKILSELMHSANDLSRVVESVGEVSKEVLVSDMHAGEIGGSFPTPEYGSKENSNEEGEIKAVGSQQIFNTEEVGPVDLGLEPNSIAIKEGAFLTNVEANGPLLNNTGQSIVERNMEDSFSNCEIGDSNEDIESFEDTAATRHLANILKDIEEVADTEMELKGWPSNALLTIC